MKTHFGKHERLENILRPISGVCFHGEIWFKCPKCCEAFEFFDAQFERNFIHVRNQIYQHKCGQLIDMT